MIGARLLALALLGGLALFGAPAAAQAKEKLRLNDPRACPYCHGDPELMKAAGLVSHYGFEFATSDTAQIDAFLPTVDIRWLESAHFRLGMALPSAKFGLEEKDKIESELTRLNAVLPDVSPKLKVLDSWLRVHIFALRCEDIYQRMHKLMRVEEKDFPDGTRPWDMKSKYMGEGPYFGMKAKYEVFVLPTKPVYTEFLKKYYGLQTQTSQRWNVIKRDALSTNCRLDEGNLRKDSSLHGHLGFNIAQNMLDGYRHYSYDVPVWIKEGISHFIEREIDPKHNSFDASEGAGAEMTTKEKWLPEVRSMISKGTAPRMAELASLKTFAEFKLPHHYATWSMVEWLANKRPEQLACFLDKLKGKLNEQGIADGSRMGEYHREVFKQCFDMGFAEFDAAWQAYVLAIEDGPPK